MSEIRPLTRRSRKSKLKFLGIVGCALIVAYFVLTSGVFLKAVVLPIAAGKLNADLSVSDISLSPFSKVELRQLVLKPRGAEPLVSIGHARIRYGLFAILSGEIRLDEVLVEGPEFDLVTHPDGTSNLSRWLAGLPKAPDKPEGVVTPVPRLRISNVQVTGGRVRVTRNAVKGDADAMEISGLQVALSRLENGAGGKLVVSAEGSESRGATNQLRFKASGSLDLALDASLMPAAAMGSIAASVSTATGSFAELADAALSLDVDVKSPEIRQVRLSVRRKNDELARLMLSGPYDASRQEARIGYELASVDRKVLGLVGAIAGIDFGASNFGATGRVDVSPGASKLTISTKVAARSVSLRMPAVKGSGLPDRVTPTIEADIDFQSTVNLADSTALVDRANISVRQNGIRVIEGAMDRPMNLSWGGGRQGFREATYTVSVGGLELDPWKSFQGPNSISGTVEANLSLTAKNDGQQLALQGTLGMNRAKISGNAPGLDRLSVQGKLSGSLDRFRVADIDSLVFDVRRDGDPLVRLSASGRFDSETAHIAAQLNTELELPLLLAIAPIQGMQLKSGSLKATAQYRVQPDSKLLTAEIGVLGVTGNLNSVSLTDYQARWDGTIELGTDVIRIKRSAVSLQSGFKPGGSVEMDGEIQARLPWAHAGEFSLQRGKFSARLSNLNEAGLGPWMAASIAPNRLLSILVEGAATAQFDVATESRIQSSVKVSNLRVSDPQSPDGRKPIQLGLAAEASAKGTTFDIQRVLLQLGPTSNAINELLIAGRLDLGGTNAAARSGTISVTSEGLDLTPLASVFGAATGTNAPVAAAKPKPATNSDTAPEVEPAPVTLPFGKFDADVKIGRIFLRDLAVTNLNAHVAIKDGRVTADPFALSVNGAPISAKAALNLGVPGFTYDVAFDATKIPVKPVASSVLSGELVNLHGEVSAGMKLSGAGITGAGLRKNLAGTVSFDAKGLDYQITALQTPLLRTLTTVLATVLQMPNIGKSPLDAISLKSAATNGVVNVESAKVSSPAFLAEARGQVALADRLPQSTLNLPISVSIPKNGQYERLPDFLTMKGTLAKPDPSYDARAIPAILTRLPGGVGSAVSSGLNKLSDTVNKATSGFLSPGTTAPANTNAPAGAKPANAIGGLLNSLGNALNGAATGAKPAAAPNTNAPAPKK